MLVIFEVVVSAFLCFAVYKSCTTPPAQDVAPVEVNAYVVLPPPYEEVLKETPSIRSTPSSV